MGHSVDFVAPADGSGATVAADPQVAVAGVNLVAAVAVAAAAVAVVAD